MKGSWPGAGSNLWIRWVVVLSNGRDKEVFMQASECPIVYFSGAGVGDFSGASLPPWVRSGPYRAVFDYEIWEGKPEEGRLLKKDSAFSELRKP